MRENCTLEVMVIAIDSDGGKVSKRLICIFTYEGERKSGIRCFGDLL